MSLSETRFGANARGLFGPEFPPALAKVLSRRAALIGAVSAAAAPAAARAPTLSLNDARLVALADAMEAIHQAAEAHVARHHGRETDETEEEFSSITTSYSPVEEELAATAATSMWGALAKARACQVPTLRDVDGGPVALSLADDLHRLYAEGRLAHA